MIRKIKESAELLKNKGFSETDILIVTGTGLSFIEKIIQKKRNLSYSEIPYFPVSTVLSHKGELRTGEIEGKKVTVMSGRFHRYEGYSFQEIIFPFRVLFYLGAKLFIVSNAAGGVNPDFELGDIMIINDHINLMGGNPLIGENLDEMGDRFPSMLNAYSKEYIEKINKIAEKHGIKIQNGVYCALHGPSLETNAEYRMMRIIGADAVGMSTVPEVIAARHMNVPVLGISIITNLNTESKKDNFSHEHIIENASKNEENLKKILVDFIKEL